MNYLTTENGVSIKDSNPLPVKLPVVSQTPGSAVASKEVVLLGASDGTNAQGLRVDAQKNLLVGLRSSSGAEPAITTFSGGDGLGTSSTGMGVGSYSLGFNGATWDRIRTNTEGTLLASAARTATVQSSDQTNHNAKGVIIGLNITANPGAAENLVIEIQRKDPVSGAYTKIASRTAVAGANVYVSLTAYPGASAAAATNENVSVVLPRTWRVNIIHSGSGSWTYSVSYQYVV